MTDLADQLERELPFLRRYARALTGSQTAGDDLAFAALQAIRADRGLVEGGHPIRVGLFAVFHQQWVRAHRTPPGDDGDSNARALLAALPPDSRETLLLATLEGFSGSEIGFILGVPVAEVGTLLRKATLDMEGGASGDILVIEDESLIAADLSSIVEQIGHQVVGVARTHTEALSVVKDHSPDLILADIQLADGSSGVDAVKDILETFGKLPVIFITAFPERLLTGERPEPAFLITKPYTNEQVTSAVSQAMFFASTDTLTVD